MQHEAEVTAKIIRERVSIRNYLPQAVKQEHLDLVLEAGRRAPSGENAQPWRFIVVRDPDMRRAIGNLARRGSGRRFTGEYVNNILEERFAGLKDPEKKKAVFDKLTSGNVSAFVASAPLIIVVVGHKLVWDTPFDCSAAIQNMLLMAHSLELGACWVNACTLDIRDELKLKKLLAIPEEYKVLSLVALGYPVHMHPSRPRKPLEQLVYDEKFGQPYAIGGGGESSE